MPYFHHTIFILMYLMAKPRWLKRALAAFAVVLFSFDTTSDTYVGKDLYDRCHYRYSASVLSFVAIPGFLTGAVFLHTILDKCGCNFKGTWSCGSIAVYVLGTLVGPILFIPFSFCFLVYAVFRIDDLEEKSKV